MVEHSKERYPRFLEFPLEYFDVQVQFAKKWSELTDEPLSEALLRSTALYRRVVDKWAGKDRPLSLDWVDLCQKIEGNPQMATYLVYALYTRLPSSRYLPPDYPENDMKHFGSFSFDYHPDERRVKVHFINLIRGARSGLGLEHLKTRREDLKKMFTFIHDNHEDAREVVGGSWLYNLDAYNRIFSPTYTKEMYRLYPPKLGYVGNAVWGQFVDSMGGPNRKLCEEFFSNVEKAETVGDLIDAFPYPTLQPHDNIQNFYEFLGIE